jgi:secernin
MHEHESAFTWGNTAGSMIVEMGEGSNDLTVIWWTPGSPCIGAYIPIFLESAEIPQTLQTPEPVGRVLPPEDFQQPVFDSASYWWRFQNLLDAAKGDSSGSRFSERQALIRERFNRLEIGWGKEVTDLRHSFRVADNRQRIDLALELRALTSRAVTEVDAEIDSFLLEYAPAGRGCSLDPRWA